KNHSGSKDLNIFANDRKELVGDSVRSKGWLSSCVDGFKSSKIAEVQSGKKMTGQVTVPESKINTALKSLQDLLVAIQDIKWLQENMKKKNGCLAWRLSQIIPIYVDALTTGWSAILKKKKAFGNWENYHKHTNIALLESTTALLGLESFVHIIMHQWVTIYIDN
ncbi:20618_t:CDS:2, partial [Cetraspora pellucida]